MAFGGMGQIGSLYVKIGAEMDDLKRGLEQSEGLVSKTASLIGGLGKVAMAAGAVGFTALAGGISMSVKEAAEAEEVQAKLRAVLKSTGGKAGVTADKANELADSLSGVTKFGDEAILSGENLLLTFTNIGKDIFPQATEAMLDMSEALGQDLKSSAIQLGKALNDPVQGMTALRRVGVAFTDEQENLVKNLVAQGKTLEAQKLILREIQTEFGGAARAAGDTFSGQIAILQNQLSNLAETVGTALLPILKDGIGAIGKLFSDPAVLGGIDKFAAGIRGFLEDWKVSGPGIALMGAGVSESLVRGIENGLQRVTEQAGRWSGFFGEIAAGLTMIFEQSLGDTFKGIDWVGALSGGFGKLDEMMSTLLTGLQTAWRVALAGWKGAFKGDWEAFWAEVTAVDWNKFGMQMWGLTQDVLQPGWREGLQRLTGGASTNVKGITVSGAALGLLPEQGGGMSVTDEQLAKMQKLDQIVANMSLSWDVIQDAISASLADLQILATDIGPQLLALATGPLHELGKAIANVRNQIALTIAAAERLAVVLANLDAGVFQPGSPSPLEISLMGINRQFGLLLGNAGAFSPAGATGAVGAIGGGAVTIRIDGNVVVDSDDRMRRWTEQIASALLSNRRIGVGA